MAARNHFVTSGPHEKSDPLGRSLDKYEPDVTIIKIAIRIKIMIIIIAILKTAHWKVTPQISATAVIAGIKAQNCQ